MPNVSLLATMADQTASQIAGAASDILPTGTVLPFAGSSAPAGWLLCAGGEYLKTGTYAPLFAVIGVTYGETNGSGGAGTTHFRVPDCQGIFISGAGSQTVGGKTYTKALGTKQSETTAKNGLSTAASSVTGSVGGTDGGHGHTMRFRTPSGLGIGGDDGRYMLVGTDTPAGYAQPNMSNGGHGHGFSLSAGAQTISGDAETRPANIAMNYIIKV